MGLRSSDLSFELFPPKTEKGSTALFGHLQKLAAFQPDCVTCTYGAGGSTQDKTLEVISKVRQDFGLPVATHLTCVGRTADEIGDYLERGQRSRCWECRGTPRRSACWRREISSRRRAASPMPTNWSEFIRARSFPRWVSPWRVIPRPIKKHLVPRSTCRISNAKSTLGADVIVTQLFYDNRDFFQFRDRCEAIGISTPIVPGLLPITNLEQIKRITSLCGAKLPAELLVNLEKYADDPEGQFEVGVESATRQSEELVQAQVAGLHYYVLNKSQAALRVLNSVSLPR